MNATDPIVVEYAIRYCMTRLSYAFGDGLDLAEAHWAVLSPATKRDVLEAIIRDPARLDGRLRPNIAEALRNEGISA